MEDPKYLDLQRKFVEHEPSAENGFRWADFGGKKVGWSVVLLRRASVVHAPANFGKTTEMEAQASRLRNEGHKAVFVALRRVRAESSFEAALLQEERVSYDEWRSNPISTLTVFLDSLDEASPKNSDDLSLPLALVTRAVGWPASDVRWVISTRPAMLTNGVINQLRRTFSRGQTLSTTTGARSTSPGQTTVHSAFSERVVDPETLAIFSMSSLEGAQAVRYMRERLNVSRAPEVLAMASRRGLNNLTGNPGGLSMLADIDLLNNPPDSLTDIFERLEAAVWVRLSRDERIEAAGDAAMDIVKRTVRRLAAASQLCHLPNIELPQDELSFSPDALSARLISGGEIAESVLQALMGSHGFIDSGSGHHQVKIFPDELPAYMGAKYLSDLARSPELALQLVAALSWDSSSGECGVNNRLLPLMGWLSTFNQHCRTEILKKDPQALAFFGDLRNSTVPRSDAEQALRKSVISIVDRHDRLGRGQFRLTSENYWQAGPARLAPTITDLFRQYGQNSRARDVLLDIAAYAGSDILRPSVMAASGGDYPKLLKTPLDVHYLIELGQQEDLDGLATALLDSQETPSSLAARLVEKLSWNYLKPRDIMKILERPFARGRSGFELTLEVRSTLVPAASEQQLFELVRRLALKASATRERPGKRVPRTHQANERFIELTADVLSAMIRRKSSIAPRKLALLCLILLRIVREAHHGTADMDELKEALKEHSDVRQAYFRLLVQWASIKSDQLWHYLFGYGNFCSPSEEDVKVLELAPLAMVFSEEMTRIEKARAMPHRAPARKDRLTLTVKAKAELGSVVEKIRDATALDTIAWLSSWLLQTNNNSRYGEVDFSQFEKRAGRELAEAVRTGLARLWRTRAPTFKEDEPNSTYHITAAGLQGLHMELRKGESLPNLSPEEVRQAIRYGAFEINGYPDWFWALVSAHREIASRELEKIANAAGDGAVSRAHAENLFSALDDAPQSIRDRLAPSAWNALKVEGANGQAYIVGKMLRATTATAEGTSQAEFEHLAWQRISEAAANEVSVDVTQTLNNRKAMDQAVVWGSHWILRHPRSFVERMQLWLTEHPELAKNFLFELAAELGKERGALLRSVAKTDDGVDSLGALYITMREVVDPMRDKNRPSGEVYSPGRQDHAQDLRESIVPAIAEAGTERAYLVLEWLKLKLGPDQAPYFKYFQYFLRETMLTPAPVRQQDFGRFETDLRRLVTDSQSFNFAVQSSLLAVKYDIERGEHSLRRFFSAINFNAIKTDSAGLALESDFQQLLASELKHYASGQFTVQRESETAEHNRRDVHCTKESLELTASIELKMSERWTFPDYLEALEHQLVGQYMRHRNAKSGFMVVVLQRNRSWREPGTGKWLSFDELIGKLQNRADFLMSADSTLFLRVIGINAIVPKNFRDVRANSRNKGQKLTRGKRH
jgi:hypothetical protein